MRNKEKEKVKLIWCQHEEIDKRKVDHMNTSGAKRPSDKQRFCIERERENNMNERDIFSKVQFLGSSLQDLLVRLIKPNLIGFLFFLSLLFIIIFQVFLLWLQQTNNLALLLAEASSEVDWSPNRPSLHQRRSSQPQLKRS